MCVNCVVPLGTSSAFPNRVLFHAVSGMPDIPPDQQRSPYLPAPQLASFFVFSFKAWIHCEGYIPGEVISGEHLKDIPFMSNSREWKPKD